MLRLSCVLLLSVSCLAAPPAEEPTHQITFKAVTAFGDPLAIHVTALADPLHRRDLASHCNGFVCSDIPEGPYTYAISIDATGRRVEGSVVVYRTNQVVVVDVGTPAADLDEGTFPTIHGKVTHAADPAKVWVRLQQLYSDISASARVDKDGTFQLDNVRPGNWMLLIFVDGKLVHFQPVTCKEKDNPPISVDLGALKPLVQV